MRMLRSFGQQVLLSFVVLSGVFAAGYFAGSSSRLSQMEDDCQQAKGTWSDGLCTVAGASQ